MDPRAAIQKRTSRRSYTVASISSSDIEFIKNLLVSHDKGPLGNACHFSLVSKEQVQKEKIKLGTYGFIQGARYFIAGHTANTKEAILDYGYLLEKIILELSDKGFGTCWLGGTFDRGEFAKAIDLPKDQSIPAISPVGWATPSRSIGDRIIRVGAGSKKRKAWEELFFYADSLQPCQADDSNIPVDWLEMLRLAPSASNNQPWRVLLEKGAIHLYLSRKPGYQKMFGHVDIQMIDMGIAQCHLDLMAKADGQELQWSKIDAPRPMFEWEYVITGKR